ncbi:poly-gamma-glutamate biosynthesis protein PgsC/CapC [Halobellus rufus]|uniref:poly-gamma-glutamate biosynthesis protein PgsC/CapC n=1 Tax=Halobellus rufus TaxID=1448860 RepID=UPI0006785CCB|nr:poly-gamma-glutamate biosynthesis protein PgsC/CapC [Halobellus rufus]
MIVAVAITAAGVFAVGVITQLFGYRLGGTITIPVLAVYTLKDAMMLPIFALSTVLAYVGLWLAKHRTLIYGRDELLVSMAVGSAVPLVLLVVLGNFLSESLRSVVFIGSILPGLAAYNYHQIKPQFRRWDLVTTVVLLVALVALGWTLVAPRFADTLGTLTPLVLYSPTADVAVLRGAVLDGDLYPPIVSRPIAIGLFVIGIFLSERIRSRYGVRTGLLAMALLSIYALANVWLVGLYLLVLALAYLGLRVVHRRTLLYGRVLVATATTTALLVVVPLVLLLPVTRGLSAYFVAILAGVNAYSWHVTAPTQRRLFVPLQLGAFLSLIALGQAVSLFRPDLVPRSLGLPALLGCAVVALGCIALAERQVVALPDRDAVFEASILSGGGDA